MDATSLYGALLLDYDAKDEIGAVLPYRLVPSILIGSVNDVRQLAGAPLMDYDAVEGTGAVLPCRQYIEAAGREMDEESGRGFQCRLFSLAAQHAKTGATMRVTMVAEAAVLMARVLLLDYDAEGDAKQRKKSTE